MCKESNNCCGISSSSPCSECISIDTCLISETPYLKDRGIEIIECYCGKDKGQHAHITVSRLSISKMVELGYRMIYNEDKPNAFNEFMPIEGFIDESSLEVKTSRRQRKSIHPPWVVRGNRDRVYDRDKNICQYCGCGLIVGKNYVTDNSATLDHIIPISRGGSNDMSNLVASCNACNTLKGTYTIQHFRKVLMYCKIHDIPTTKAPKILRKRVPIITDKQGIDYEEKNGAILYYERKNK